MVPRHEAQRPHDMNTPAAVCCASGAVSLTIGGAVTALLQLQAAGAGVLGTCLHQGRLHDICQLACAAAPHMLGCLLPLTAHVCPTFWCALWSLQTIMAACACRGW